MFAHGQSSHTNLNLTNRYTYLLGWLSPTLLIYHPFNLSNIHNTQNSWLLVCEFFVLKYEKNRDQIAQTHTHTQMHRNNVWSELVTCTRCVVFFNCILPPWYIYYIWDISTPTFHKLYGFIQILSIFIPLTITIIWLRVTWCSSLNTIQSSNFNTLTLRVIKGLQFHSIY